jgi:ABC-type Mn2+/Zn2+ transport system permease subunit
VSGLAPDGAVIAVGDLHKRYGSVRAVDGVSFEVRRGEIFGLLGLLGVTIVVSIQAVGIILVVAMLVTPAATAQLVVTRFSRLVTVSIAVAVVSALAGLYVSFYWNVASGATIVLFETLFFGLALVLGPRTGVLRGQRA